VQGSKLNPLDKVGHKTLFEKDAETKEEHAEKKRAKEEEKEANRVEAKRLEANKEAREGRSATAHHQGGWLRGLVEDANPL
jgi:hypothetical protein